MRLEFSPSFQIPNPLSIAANIAEQARLPGVVSTSNFTLIEKLCKLPGDTVAS